MKKFKGQLIVFEGPEGSGKTTQINLLYEYLRKVTKNVARFREPGSTHVGEMIREILLECKDLKFCALTEMLLYQASRAQFVTEKLIALLEKGYIVLLDRFTDATLAYQGYGEGVNLELIEKLNEIVTCGIKPDVTILLDIGVKKGLRRALAKCGTMDRMERKSMVFHNRVRQGYLKLADKNKRIKLLDGTQEVHQIQEQIRKLILDAVGKRIKRTI